MPGRKIVDAAQQAPPFQDVVSRVRGGKRRLWVGGLLGSSKSLLAAVLSREFPSTWVVIAPTFSDAEHVHDDLVTFLGEDEVQLFSEWETLPYERRSPLATITESRILTLSRLSKGERVVIVTTPKGAMQTTLSRKLLNEVTHTLKVGATLDLAWLSRYLVDLGC